VNNIVIIGAGQAGGWAARTLRDNGFIGSIRLIGEEPYPPYERPPLSKDIVQGEAAHDSSFLWTPDKQAELRVETHFGSRVTRIDRAAKQISLTGGELYPYDRLLLTTGSRVRRLNIPGVDLAGIYYLRGIDDALAIKAALRPGAHLLIVGAGWIGMEVAASARKLGVDVVVTDVCAYPCARVLPEDIGNYLLRRHQDNGVRTVMNTTVQRLTGHDKIESAHLSNGEVAQVSAVLIGIGVLPNAELAADSGIATDNGIVVDEFGRTSDDSVFAAGDVASQPAGKDMRIRHESWANAQNHAITVAKAMLDQGEPFADIPYFWSDQYELNLQMIGTLADHDEAVLRGSLDTDQFIRLYLREKRIVGAIGVNSAQDISIVKRLMQRNFTTSAQQLSGAPTLRKLLTS
jgi:3-phenylpropionate/trans-cinnamate dioxygenase ferredoxin reductase subunit